MTLMMMVATETNIIRKRSSKFYPTTRIISFEEELDYILSHLKNPFGRDYIATANIYYYT